MKAVFRSTPRVAIALVVLLVGSVVLAMNAQAVPRNPHEITLAVSRDGSSPFDLTDDVGEDTGPNNLRVRSYDVVAYEFEGNINWNVPVASNVTFEATLPEGASWTVRPDVCLANDVSPESSITDGGRTLICNVGDKQQGTAIRFTAIARVGGLAEGDQIVLEARITDDLGNSATSNQTVIDVTAKPALELRKGANGGQTGNRPSFQHFGRFDGGNDGALVAFPIQLKAPGASGVGSEPITGDVSFIDDYSDLIAKFPNARLVDFALPESFGGQQPCGASHVNYGGNVLYGAPGIEPEATSSNSAVDSGTWTCVNNTTDHTIEITVSGADFVTPPTTSERVFASGMVIFFIPVSDIPATQTLAVNLVSDLQASGVSGEAADVVTTNNTAEVRLLRPNPYGPWLTLASAWIHEYGIASLDPASASYGLARAATGGSEYIDIGLLVQGPTSAYNFGSSTFSATPLSPFGSGDGRVVTGQTAIIQSGYDRLAPQYAGTYRAAQCVRWDSSLAGLTDGPDTILKRTYNFDSGVNPDIVGIPEEIPSPHTGPVWVDFGTPYTQSSDPAGTGGVFAPDQPQLGVDYILEYANIDYSAFGPNGLTDVDCNDPVPVDGWSDDPAQIGYDAINAVRLIRLTEKAMSYTVSMAVFTTILASGEGTVVPMATDFTAAPTQAELEDRLSGASGTAGHCWDTNGLFNVSDCSLKASTRADYVTPKSTEYGDRLLTSGVIVQLDKNGDSPQDVPFTPVARPGEVVTYRIFADIQGVQGVTNAAIRDLPHPQWGSAYEPGTTKVLVNGAEVSTADPVAAAYGSYTYYTWELGDLPANAEVEIVYGVRIPSTAQAATSDVNYADFISDQTTNQFGPDLFTLAESQKFGLGTKSDYQRTVLGAPHSEFLIAKSTQTPVIEVNGDIEWRIDFSNVGSTTLGSLDVIDVLPHNGDGGAELHRSDTEVESILDGSSGSYGADGLPIEGMNSTYDGLLFLAGPLTGSPQQSFYYTTADPTTISQDPQHVSNLDGGATTWCLEVDFGTDGCPSGFGDVTAFRVFSQEPLLPQTSRFVELTGKTLGNHGCPVDPQSPDCQTMGLGGVNTYTNDFGAVVGDDAAVDGALLRVFSNDVTTQVVASSLGDFVWKDVDADGIQDEGEEPLADVVVQLLTADLKPIYTHTAVVGGVETTVISTDETFAWPDGQSTTGTALTTETKPDGSYEFTNLPSGQYVVKFVAPEGYVLTTQNAEAGDDVDSNADPATGLTSVIDLGVGTHDPTIDAGVYRPASVGDFVWLDLDQNGVQNGGAELGLADVRVELRDGDGKLLDFMLTNEVGWYEFNNLPPGDYVIVFVPPAGYSVSPTDQGDDEAGDSDGLEVPVSLSEGEHDPTIDLGVFPSDEEFASVGDFVWLDLDQNGVQNGGGEVGVADVRVELRDVDGKLLDFTLTNGVGWYEFNNLPPGDYVIVFVPPAGYSVSPTGQGGNDELDSDGLEVPVSLAPGEHDPTIDLGVYEPGPQVASVGDFVWLDLDRNGVQNGGGEVGVADVRVELRDGDGKLLDFALTNAVGWYEFSDLPPGDYVIVFVPPAGYSVSPTNQGGNDELDSDGLEVPVSLAAGEHDPTIDLGLYQPDPELATLGDRVWLDRDGDGVQDGGEPGIPGVTVTLTYAGPDNQFGTADDETVSTTTDVSGMYLFTDLPPGEYQVAVTPPANYLHTGDPDGVLNNKSQTNLSAGEVDLTQDFGYQPQLVSLGDLVWLDSDRDNRQDQNEPGVKGVTVTLYAPMDGDDPADPSTWTAVATTTTDANGHYQFDDLVPGPYVVGFTWPGGYEAVTPLVGSGATDSNGDPTTGLTGVIELTADDMTIDMGLFVPVHDLALIKTTEATSVKVGDVVGYSILIANQGEDATTFVVTDYIPDGMSVVGFEISDPQNTGVQVDVTSTRAGEMDFTIGADARKLQPGETLTILVEMRVDSAKPRFDNYAAVTSDEKTDVDSTPSLPGDDLMIDHINQSGIDYDGRDDEDDSDVAVVQCDCDAATTTTGVAGVTSTTTHPGTTSTTSPGATTTSTQATQTTLPSPTTTGVRRVSPRPAVRGSASAVAPSGVLGQVQRQTSVQGSPSLGQAPVSGLNNQRVAYTGSDNSMLLLLGGGMLLLGLALAVGAARRRRQAS